MALLGLDTTGQRLHWRLCARIINTYRRMARDDFQIKEHQSTEEKERQKEEEQLRIYRTKRRAKVNQVQGSRKNAATSNALKVVFRFKSKGKGRPSHKKVRQFVSYPTTIHLKGSTHNGGYQL